MYLDLNLRKLNQTKKIYFCIIFLLFSCNNIFAATDCSSSSVKDADKVLCGLSKQNLFLGRLFRTSMVVKSSTNALNLWPFIVADAEKYSLSNLDFLSQADTYMNFSQKYPIYVAQDSGDAAALLLPFRISAQGNKIINIKGKNINMPLYDNEWVDFHLQYYCSSWEQSEGLCKQNNTKDNIHFNGIDLSFNNLMQPVIPNLISSETIPGTNYKIDLPLTAAQRYIYNIAGNLPSNLNNAEFLANCKLQSKSGQVNLSSACAKTILDTYIRQSKLSMAQNIMNKLLQNHKQISKVGIDANGFYTIGKNEKNKVVGQKATSKYDLLRYEANWRFKKDKKGNTWFNELGKMSQTDLLHEIAAMQAVQLKLSFARYSQNQNIEAALASLLADSANNKSLLASQKFSQNAKLTESLSNINSQEAIEQLK